MYPDPITIVPNARAGIASLSQPSTLRASSSSGTITSNGGKCSQNGHRYKEKDAVMGEKLPSFR